MKCRSWRVQCAGVLIRVVAVVVFAQAGAPARAQDVEQPPACTDAYLAISAAVAASDRAGLERWARQVNRIVGCDARESTLMRRRASRALVVLADAARAQGASAEELQARYEAARRAYATWEATLKLANLAFDAKRLDVAEGLYNETLNEMDTLFPGEPPVPAATRAWTDQRANEIGMLVAHPSVPPPNRAGEPGGIDAQLVAGSGRSVGVAGRKLPVTFVFAKAEMTPEGLMFAQQWIESLRGAPLPAVVLAGHTDSQGDRELDEVLAVNRARAVATLMRANGFRVTVLGYGRRCQDVPFTAAYSDEQRNRILRRVEVLPGDVPPPGYCRGETPRPG